MSLTAEPSPPAEPRPVMLDRAPIPYRVQLTFMALGYGLGLGLLLIQGLFDLEDVYAVGVTLIGVTLIAAVEARLAIYRRRIWHRLVRARFRLCPNCLYDLTGSPHQGDCPECGFYYETAKLPAFWRRRFVPPTLGRRKRPARGLHPE